MVADIEGRASAGEVNFKMKRLFLMMCPDGRFLSASI